jgi:hypothetical protein
MQQYERGKDIKQYPNVQGVSIRQKYERQRREGYIAKWQYPITIIRTGKTHYKMSSPRQYFERKSHKVKSQNPKFSEAP